MSFKFSVRSEQKLNTVHRDLGIIARKVIEISPIDFSITCGYRSQQEQMRLYAEKKSKCDGIEKKSKHQEMKAIDIMPCREKYSQEPKDIFILVGLFIAVAKQLNIKIRVGALWNHNSTIDNNFIDAFHIELVN